MAEHDPSPKKQSEMVDLNIAELKDDQIPKSMLTSTSRFNPDSHFVIFDKRRIGDTNAFSNESENLSSLQPRPHHWSVAWSDLMMTMFVLFFIMFLYKSDDLQQLNESSPAVLADIIPERPEAPPEDVIIPEQGMSLTTKKTKKIQLRTEPVLVPSPEKREPPQPVILDARSDTPVRHPLKAPSYTAPGISKRIEGSVGEVVEVRESPQTKTTEVIQESQERAAVLEKEPSFEEIYTRGTTILQKNNLSEFAAIDIVPGKTVRLILTGDLLFPTALATLTPAAKNSLEKITTILKETTYQINVEGHTDNVPINTSQFPSNWELSLARANSVARLLIDETGVTPQQIVVSGFAFYRPVASNETAAGRAKNRRVEVILTRSNR